MHRIYSKTEPPTPSGKTAGTAPRRRKSRPSMPRSATSPAGRPAWLSNI